MKGEAQLGSHGAATPEAHTRLRKGDMSQRPTVVTARARPSLVVLHGTTYAIANALMLVVNKSCLQRFPAPATLLTIQLAFSSCFFAVTGLDLKRHTLKDMTPYFYASCTFSLTLFTSMKAVQRNRLDLFVCLRAFLPVVLIWLESFTLGTPSPSMVNLVPLVGVAIGMAMYASQFENRTGETSLFWIFLWYVSCIVDSLVVKNTLNNSRRSAKTNAFLLNACAVPLLLLLSVVFNEVSAISAMDSATCAHVIASSVLGFLLAYSGTSFRMLISATMFALVGNICKAVSAGVSVFIWEVGCNVTQWVGICIALLSGSCFRGAGEENAQLLKEGTALLMFAMCLTLLYTLTKSELSISLSSKRDPGLLRDDCSMLQGTLANLC